MTDVTEPTEGEISAAIDELYIDNLSDETSLKTHSAQEGAEADHLQVVQRLRLPFGYAQRFNVLLSQDDQGFILHCLENVSHFQKTSL